ncbi:ABC transporter ATP-binding protein [bacterium]|nr:ABC transporter ATP-binding protein [bacterium]|tara:strand:- start:333 stop:716 length:384 start_codon:yes stop_codon:yes gene_type:complete
MQYGYAKTVNLPFAEVIEKVTESLAREGFGVLTTIDVKATMKKKLDVEYENYTILGACNPPFAHQALQAEKEIGLLLPCNVIVYEADGAVHLSAILPVVAMSMVENEELKDIASQVEEKLKSAIDAV